MKDIIQKSGLENKPTKSHKEINDQVNARNQNVRLQQHLQKW